MSPQVVICSYVITMGDKFMFYFIGENTKLSSLRFQNGEEEVNAFKLQQKIQTPQKI